MFRATDRTYFGLPGFASDTITVKDKLRQRVKLYAMKEERVIEPETFAHLVSSTLYERRFGPYFVEPVIAGINSKDEPFIAAMDLIGCLNFAKVSPAVRARPRLPPALPCEGCSLLTSDDGRAGLCRVWDCVGEAVWNG